MAQDSDLSKSADKGKGKAVEDETQKDKAGQAAPNGKKDEDKDECLFPSLRHALVKPGRVWAVLTAANSLRRAQRGGSTAEE